MNGMFFWEEKNSKEQIKQAFQKNWKLYVCEALGLAIFMISACFFGALLEGKTSWHQAIPNAQTRSFIAGILMGSTALFIFYLPYTSPSGAQINPAVTLCFLRLKKISKWDALFYIIFQVIGGTVAVYAMVFFMGNKLTAFPVNYVATVPAQSVAEASATEFIIGFIMMSMVLFTSSHQSLKIYTRLFSGCLVCLYVIFAGPISGFGMNPARSLASAIPSNTWTAFWIYAFVPVVSMLAATEFFLVFQKRKREKEKKYAFHSYQQKSAFDEAEIY